MLKKQKENTEIVKFRQLESWMKLGGADTSKLELRYYSEDNRGVHAA